MSLSGDKDCKLKKESDSNWVDPALDDGRERFFDLTRCPLETDRACPLDGIHRTWKTFHATSQHREFFLSIVKSHLTNSPLHRCGHDEADVLNSQMEQMDIEDSSGSKDHEWKAMKRKFKAMERHEEVSQGPAKWLCPEKAMKRG